MIESKYLETKQMKKEVITLEKITYENYIKVLFGLNAKREQKELKNENLSSHF